MTPTTARAWLATRGFLAWWILELRTALAELCTLVAPRWRKRLTVFVSRARLQVVDGDSRSDPPVVDLARTESGSLPLPPLSEVQTAVVIKGRRAQLVFDPDFAFIRRLRMPLAALAHLDSAIELQQPKLLPLEAGLLSAAYEIATIDEPNAAIDIDLAAVKRSDVEPLEKALEQWGLQVDSMHLGRAADSRFRFAFATSRTHPDHFLTTGGDILWAASAVALMVCALAVWELQTVRAERSLQQALADTAEQASAVLEKRQQLTSRLETLAQLARIERTPTAAAILTDITRHLNRDVWLTTFELKGRTLRIVGLAADPAATVKDLAASTLITDIELRSSMFAGTNTGKDRFEITAQIRARI